MTYTRDHMEAACCLWEAMLDFYQRNVSPTFRTAYEEHGTCAMRDLAIDLAEPCDKAWKRRVFSDDDKGEPFDWEFCPTFIASLDWTQWPPVQTTANRDH